MSPEGLAAQPEEPEVPQPILRMLLGFAREARDNGFPVGIEESLDALTLASEFDLLDREELRRGLRALFCASPTDWKRFDDLFDSYWVYDSRRVRIRVSGSVPRAGAEGEASGPLQAGSAAGAGMEETVGGASASERLAGTDFRHLETAEDQKAVEDLTERLARKMRWRLARRQRARRRGRRIDLRKTIHRSLRHGGLPLDLTYRRRHPKPMKLVMLLDASGSMSLYSRFFIRFVRGIVGSFDQSDAFVFHTRLVHISSVLRERDLEKAVERMSLISAGWGGGTKLGESLRSFNDHYAKQVLTARSVAVILSDGYDTGAPELLGEEMARLGRRARRVIWLNPMIGWRGYEPVAQGMVAALPHVDLFAPAHNLESLAALEPQLAKL